VNDILEERAQGSQPLIARSNVIMSLGLQSIEKGDDSLTRQIGDRQSAELAPALLGHRLQEQGHAIPVASDRSQAQPFLTLEVILEKAMQQFPECWGIHGVSSEWPLV
jgi:hypothetical protein